MTRDEINVNTRYHANLIRVIDQRASARHVPARLHYAHFLLPCLQSSGVRVIKKEVVYLTTNASKIDARINE